MDTRKKTYMRPECIEDGCKRQKHYKSGRCRACERQFKGEEAPECIEDGCKRQKHYKSGRCRACECQFTGEEVPECIEAGCKRQKYHKSGRCCQYRTYAIRLVSRVLCARYKCNEL